MLKVNDEVNWFTVLEIISPRRIKVRCSCGEECYRRQDHLLSGRTKSCKRCSAKRTASDFPPPSQLYAIGDLGKTYYSSLREGAKIRNLEFAVTQEDLWILLVQQNFKCALTGVDINLSTKIRKCNPDYKSFTASLDRIDSSKGYVPGNIQWVHKTVNRLKNNLNQDDFIKCCIAVARYANQQPSQSPEIV